jgi:undecaprenyl diphosphate synthase
MEIIVNPDKLTAKNDRLHLTIALDYGGRQDIIEATKVLIRQGINPDTITEEIFANASMTAGLPDPDLLIRTSGEERISNFLLWQCAYTEFFFTDVLWPDFNRDHFEQAIIEYACRQRRFGGVEANVNAG